MPGGSDSGSAAAVAVGMAAAAVGTDTRGRRGTWPSRPVLRPGLPRIRRRLDRSRHARPPRGRRGDVRRHQLHRGHPQPGHQDRLRALRLRSVPVVSDARRDHQCFRGPAVRLSGWPANRTGWTLLRAGLDAEALHREPQLPSLVRDITPMGGAAHCRVVLEADPGSVDDHLIERLLTL
ncbi:hypothetical protein SipoB123_26535 [Streptomyces ipomoeae]|nr:hypothetical protein SipoB123_26535 [Streptomyces ipomoeae]